jgi:hypothetical protein
MLKGCCFIFLEPPFELDRLSLGLVIRYGCEAHTGIVILACSYV